MSEKNTDEQPRKGFLSRVLVGEYRWERWAFAIAALISLFVSYVANDGFWSAEFLRDGATHTFLLLAVLYYLSDMRYRLFPEVRNN
jgi:hypothetical protein